MVKKQKLYQRLINNQKNVKFNDFVTIVEAFGFMLDRIKGSHHTYKHPDVPDAFLLLQRERTGTRNRIRLSNF